MAPSTDLEKDLRLPWLWERAAPGPGTAPSRAGRVSAGVSGLAKNPVHGRSAHRALALGHPPAGLAHRDFALEVPFVFTFDTITVIRVSHVILLAHDFCPARGCWTGLDRTPTGHRTRGGGRISQCVACATCHRCASIARTPASPYSRWPSRSGATR